MISFRNAFNDKNEVREIWDYCFEDSKEYQDFYFENIYKDKNTIIGYENDKIIASLQLNNHIINLNSINISCPYIVGVSTLPEYRGNGIMKKIMDEAFFNISKSNNICILMPIDHRLYRKYGFEDISDMMEIKMDIFSLNNFKKKDYSIEKINDINLLELKNIYLDSLINYNSYAFRNDKYFRNLIKESYAENANIFLSKDKEGNYDGYIYYTLSLGKIFIRELYYKNINSLKAFLNFIYNHNMQAKEVIINTATKNSIRYILKDLKNISMKIKPFMMGRVVNVLELLKEVNIFETLDENENIKIKVIDKNIKNNDSIYHINKNTIFKVDDLNYDVLIDIKYFSQLIFSYRSVEELLFEEKLELINKEKIQILKKLFIEKNNHINEYI
ncbi:MAG: GNAT family N-acetyltransferase [Peptostreptococcaceae bacterium]|jgi:predicted acetyltransferase|nr:GNAT family N-acetyltransferase [Peptostreptococcaceae bacterium]